MFKNETVTIPTINNIKDNKVISYDNVQDIWNLKTKRKPNKINLKGIINIDIEMKPLSLSISDIGKEIWNIRPTRLILVNLNPSNFNIPRAPRNIDRTIHAQMSLFSNESPNNIQLVNYYS